MKRRSVRAGTMRARRLIVDAGRGLPVSSLQTSHRDWKLNNTLLADSDGKRLHDNAPGQHPGIVLQDDRCIIYYFTHQGQRTEIQIAEFDDR